MGAAGVTAGAAVAGTAVAGASALSNSGKGSGGSAAGTTQTAPWAPQQPYIQQGLQDASGIYAARQAQGPYTGEMVAGGNPLTTQASNYAGLYSGGTGAGLVNNMGTTAGQLGTATAPYVGNASNIAANGVTGPNVSALQGTLANYGTGAQSVQGANPALSGALNTSAVNAANGLNGFQSTLQTAANQGLANPTQQIEANAQTYANSPQVQASLAATNNAINQTLNEQTLPTQNQQEAQAGALNSSRSGMAQGMAQQAAATSEGQADASIQNNAYNTGMSTAEGLYSSGLNTATNASMYGYNDLANNANTQAGQQIGVNETNAANQLSAANSGLNFAATNTNAQLNANAQLGNASGMSLTAGNDALTGATGIYNLAASGGLLQQSMQQAGDTNLYDQYQNTNQYDQGILSNYMSIVGQGYGSQGATTTEQQNPVNLAGALTGGAAAGLGLYNTLNDQSTPAGTNLATGATPTMQAANTAMVNNYTPEQLAGFGSDVSGIYG